MCAIVDANAAHEVFGTNRPMAGRGFFDWLNTGGGRLVVGGKLREELRRSSGGFRTWAQQAVLAARLRIKEDTEVNARTEELGSDASLRSDDPHVIALAQVSGARLLYSNDGDLQVDFKNRDLIDEPRGKVYSTLVNDRFTPRRRRQLVGRDTLCQSDR